MQYSAEEIRTGTVNLFDHFAELMPKEGNSIGLITVQNGVDTSFKGIGTMTQSVIDKVPEGTLCLAMHNPSSGIFFDGIRAFFERCGFQSRIVRNTAQMMQVIAETIHKINPEMTWLDVRHSEAGVIGRRGIEMLSEEYKKLLKQHLYNISLGPAKKIPTEYCLEAYNLYSEKDSITGWWAHEQDEFTYNLEILKCITPRSERILFLADHGFLQPTYQKGLEGRLEKIQKERGFYNGNTR